MIEPKNNRKNYSCNFGCFHYLLNVPLLSVIIAVLHSIFISYHYEITQLFRISTR